MTPKLPYLTLPYPSRYIKTPKPQLQILPCHTPTLGMHLPPVDLTDYPTLP